MYGVLLTLPKFKECLKYGAGFTYRVIFFLGIGVLICAQPKSDPDLWQRKKCELPDMG